MPSSKYRNRRPRKKKSNTKKIVAIIALLAVVIIISYIMLNNNTSTEEEEEELTQMKVLLQTSMGNITIQLRDDMPITTTNFKNLVHDGTYVYRMNLPIQTRITEEL
jgi:hypothetical protein